MQHSSAIRDSTCFFITSMKKRAKEFKEGYNNWTTNGLEIAIIPVASQSNFLEKSNKELTDGLKRKGETTRIK